MNRKVARDRRKAHIRKKLSGTTDVPRVFVFKSNKFMYFGIADDSESKVLAYVKNDKSLKNVNKTVKSFVDTAKKLKKDTFVFDRSGYKFHGQIKAFVDGIRKAEIKI